MRNQKIDTEFTSSLKEVSSTRLTYYQEVLLLSPQLTLINLLFSHYLLIITAFLWKGLLFCPPDLNFRVTRYPSSRNRLFVYKNVFFCIYWLSIHFGFWFPHKHGLWLGELFFLKLGDILSFFVQLAILNNNFCTDVWSF